MLYKNEKQETYCNRGKVSEPVVHLGKIYFDGVKFSVKDEQIQVLYHG